MPRATSICAQVGCPAIASNAGRCDAHQRQAWAGSDRRDHLPRNWPTIRARVLERDGYRCQIRDDCCELLATEVDHLGQRDDHRLEMLRAACKPCHAHRSAMQGVQAKGEIAARNQRPKEPHPGLRTEPIDAAG